MIKQCKFCNKEFETNINKKVYCSETCQIKDYSKKYYEKNKEKEKADRIKYYYANRDKERKRRMEYYYNNWDKENSELNKSKRKERKKIYRQKPENKIKIKEYEYNRKHNDFRYRLKNNLRRRLLHAFEKYPNGKNKSSDEYGINYYLIIEKLMKELPKDFNEKKYHIDHKIALAKFDFNNPEEIKKAFAPENNQWLTAEENQKKWKN